MKLRITDTNDSEIKKDALSAVKNGYICFSYNMEEPIIKVISESFSLIDEQLLSEIDDNESGEFKIEDEERKKLCLKKINQIRDSLNNGIESFLECFDALEICINNIKHFDIINQLIDGIDIPIILELSDIDDEYLLKNIKKIDTELKKKHNNKITYCIKQSMDEREAHYEDNSYSADDVILALSYLDNVVEDMKRFNFTPFEQIMYVYDIVKDHRYVHEDEDEDYIESRDLVRILKNDKIVCFGFAKKFKSILDKLGIENEIIRLNSDIDDSIGHVRNMVSVVDPKYNLNHILYFDVTWDCRKDKDVIDENRYEHFARNKLFYTKKDWGKLTDYKYLPFFLRKDKNYSFLEENIPSKVRNIRKMFAKIDWCKYCNDYELDNDFVNELSDLMSESPYKWLPLTYDYEFCVEAYKECCKMLSRKIPGDAFLRCLYTVRKVQNHLYPNKYSCNYDELIDTYDKYIGRDQRQEYRLFNSLFGEGYSIYDKFERFEQEDIESARKSLLTNLKTLTNNINDLDINNSISVKEAVKILKK